MHDSISIDKGYISLATRFSIIRFSTSFLIFSNCLDDLKVVHSKIYKFLVSRNLIFDSSSQNVRCVNQGFEFFDWKFSYWKHKYFYGKLSVNTIRSHKMRLKNIVKNSFDLNTYAMIDKLNYYIFQWTINHNFTDSFWDIWSEMDTYSNKLLWKWARRRHPRRPNTWIYNKYWKSFMGSWKFFSIDSITGNINFLQSHYSLETFIYRFPISLDIYDLTNEKKVKEVCFKKNKDVLKGLYSLLWYKQQGLCFSCKRPFFFFHLGCFKLCKKYEGVDNSIFSIFMLHNYCYF